MTRFSIPQSYPRSLNNAHLGPAFQPLSDKKINKSHFLVFIATGRRGERSGRELSYDVVVKARGRPGNMGTRSKPEDRPLVGGPESG